MFFLGKIYGRVMAILYTAAPLFSIKMRFDFFYILDSKRDLLNILLYYAYIIMYVPIYTSCSFELFQCA